MNFIFGKYVGNSSPGHALVLLNILREIFVKKNEQGLRTSK